MRHLSHHKANKNFIKPLFKAIKHTLWNFSSGQKTSHYASQITALPNAYRFQSLTVLLLLMVVHLSLGNPLIASSQKEDSPRKFGEENTIHIYPGSVQSDDWRGLESVLAPDLKEDAIYQKFSEKKAAYIPSDLELRKEAENAAAAVQSASASASSSAPTAGEESVISDEVVDEPTATEVTPTPEPVLIEPVSTETPTEEAGPETTVYKRATESVLTFFSQVTQLFPLTSSTTVSEIEVAAPEELQSEEIDVVPVVTEENEQVNEVITPEPKVEIAPVVLDEPTATPSESVIVEEVVVNIVPTSTPTSTQVVQIKTDNGSTSATSSEDTDKQVVNEEQQAIPSEFKTHRITFSDFSLPELRSGETITSVQLRASLAAQYDLESSTTAPFFRLTLQTPSSTQIIGSVQVEDEVSNALNGGYFLFALPQDMTEEDFAAANITVDFVGDKKELDDAFIDAIWFEINTIRVTRADLVARAEDEVKRHLRAPSYHEQISTKFNFGRDEQLVFNMRYLSQRSRAVEAVREFIGQRKIKVEKTEVLHHGAGALGIKPDITVTSDGLVTLIIPEEEKRKMKPGLYTINLDVNEGGVHLNDSFDFQWGLLAINPSEATALVGESVDVSMGALTPNGNTICNADLRLYHVTPSEFISEVPVEQSGLCKGNNVIDVPDYTSLVTPVESGTHELYLEHLDQSGEIIANTMTTFKAEISTPLQITRLGPTRIFPPAPYAMELTVTAHESFTGTLTELVPKDFEVFNTDAAISIRGSHKELSWDLSLLGGSQRTVSYEFDAPDISPYLYELGPASLEKNAKTRTPAKTSSSSAASTTSKSVSIRGSDFIEHRQWQIASDAVGNMILLWADGASLPSGWDCISCSGGNFPQNFLVGSSSASTTGGSLTHTHTADGSVAATGDASVSETSTKNDDISPNTHTHSYDPTIGNGSNVPLYSDLRVIEYNGGAGEPGTIPAGAIGIFDIASSSLPAGWLRYGPQDGYFIRGGNTPGSTGGLNEHAHSITGSTGIGDGTPVRDRTNPTQVGAANLTHTHDVSSSTATSTIQPPYVEVVLAQLQSDAAAPNNLIAMWGADVGTGWSDISSAPGSAFNNRFLKASTTYGLTGGTSTHTHADVVNIQSEQPTGTDQAKSGTGGASDAHTHLITVSNFTTANNLPPFVTVVFGKKIGSDPVYDQLSFQWFDDQSAEPPTDPWPDGASDLAEGEAIDSNTTVVKDGDMLRLRINAEVTNASSTVGTTFKLQYAAADTCSLASVWVTMGDSASSTIWRGYDEAGVADHSTLSSSVLASSTVNETFEESGHATNTPNEIGIGEVGEWDFAIEDNGAATGTNYCFRLVEGDGTAFSTYTSYPEVLTNSAPDAPTPSVLFDNEKTASTSLRFRFVTNDPESEEVHYQIQIDDNYNFGSTFEDKSSAIVAHQSQFENQVDDTDKAPFKSGELMEFTAANTFINGTTYYWRVRAKDPNGSNSWGEWSEIWSFTIDTGLGVTAWFQTETEQFDTNTLDGIDTASNQMDLASGSTTGTSTSGSITFSGGTLGTAWGSLVVNETDSSDVVDYYIEYQTDAATWARVPDSDLPGNSSGFASTTSLLTLDVDTYDVIRVVAVFTSNAGTPSIQDWTINWGYLVETPTITKLFPNEAVGTTTPLFEFTTTDPQSDLLTYQVSWSVDDTFTSSTTRDSTNNPAGFTNTDNQGQSDPFSSGDTIQYRIQGADALTASTTYWWRVRAKDTTGDDAWSFWTEPRSFTVDLSVVASTWYQTTQEQFDTNILSGTIALGNDTVSVATTATEAMLVYGEGTEQTPRYRVWDGSAWGSESSLNNIGAPLRWARVAAGTTRQEYVAVTSGTDNDVNAQVYANGVWDDLQELTTTMGDITARGFDVAYESLSGDAMVAYCDNDTGPAYAIWNGTSWTVTAGDVGMTLSTNCEWIQLASDPTSDEIIMIARDADGDGYIARVWSGSAWGNNSSFGGMTEADHEGMAVIYEESGDQAIALGSNNNQGTFIYDIWNGSWAGTQTFSITDDLEWAQLTRDVGSDEIALCFVNDDINAGVARWTGSAWTGANTFVATYAKTEPSMACAFGDGGIRDNYIVTTFAASGADETQYSYWDNTSWSTEAQVDSYVSQPTMQLERTGEGTILGVFFDPTGAADDLYASQWIGTSSWSTADTLENDVSVDTTPYGRPYHMTPQGPSTEGTVIVSPAINFTDGSGPYWQRMYWSDTTPGTSDILYSLQYQTATGSWEFIPDSALPGNETGTSTGPIDLTGLNKNTYDVIRPYASLSCDGGSNCPQLQDWTVEWAEGITVSGTYTDYDRLSTLDSGVIGVAVNGTVQSGKTGTVSGGNWSIGNVNVSAGDIVTVFVNGTSSDAEAVGVTRYDGAGDIYGFDISRRHVSLGSYDATSTPLTNVDLGLITYLQNEDIFIGYASTTNTINLCGDSGCGDVRLYVNASTTYRAGGNLLTHDIENDGTIIATTTLYVTGSWDNNATTTLTSATVVMAATSTTESIDSTGTVVSSFNNLTFGTTTGSATWTLATALDVNGDLSVDRGTLARGTTQITVAGDLANGANGYWTGIGTTTFDGTGGSLWSDANSTLQNVGNVLVDASNKVVTLSGNVAANNVTIGSDDTIDASATHYDITVYGDWTNNNSFVARQGEVFFAATTSGRQIDVGGDNFYDLTFNGVGGGWSFVESTLDVNGDFTISTGTVMLATATTTVAGSWNSAGGTFMHGNAAVEFDGTGSEIITASTTVLNNAFHDLRITGSGDWTFTDAQSTSTGNVIIAAGSLTLPSSLFTVSGNFLDTGGSFTDTTGTVRLDSGSGASIQAGGSSFNNLTIDGTGSFIFLDASADVNGNVTVDSGTLVLPGTLLTVGGSWSNSATVDPNGGEVQFDSGATGETINFGGSTMNDVTFDSTNGGWTITNSVAVGNDFTLTNAYDFTLSSGQTLTVSGQFSNAVGGASTTWDGSTITLDSGTAYSINAKSTGGDGYGTLNIDVNTDISMWNSSSTVYTVDASGSLYSQDHNAVDGDLYIWSDYNRTSGAEYWSYQTDFDGTDLGTTSARQVDVRLASGASVNLTDSLFEVLGSSTASTTIESQSGLSVYGVSVTNGTTTAQYYEFTDLNTTGLTLAGDMAVTSLDNGAFELVGIAPDGMLVSSTTIDANPGLQIFNVYFNMLIPVSAQNVAQLDGTPASYWWFRKSTGNTDGEGFDNDTGNPGSIRWDDSNTTITVSGVVYTDDESTPMGAGTCDDSTPIVTVVVTGGGTDTGSCSSADGSFSIPNVSFTGDPVITVYLDTNGATTAAAVTKTATGDITDMDLYHNRVIVRHEAAAAMTVADMSGFDNSDDPADLKFTAIDAVLDTLDIAANNELHVWATSTFTPGGSVTIHGNAQSNTWDGSLHIDDAATFTGAGTTTYTIGGSFTLETGATYVPASTTIVMNATTTGKTIMTASDETLTLNELQFTGVGGGWSLNGNATATDDVQVATGTLTSAVTSNLELENGSFYGDGLVSLGVGTVRIDKSNTLGGTQGWTFNDLILGSGSVVGTTTPGSNATTTVGGTLTISNAHFLDAGSSAWNLSGTGDVFVETGTFLYDTSSFTYSGTAATDILSTDYYDLHFNAAGGSPTYTVTGLGVQAFGNLTVGGAGDTTVTLDTNDPALNVDGNFTIYSNGTFIASNSSSFTLAGNYDNDGTFTANSGTITLDGSGSSDIAAGNSNFATVDITGTGDFTFSEHATSISAFTIGGAANSFALNSGQTLQVVGTFSNDLGGAATTWTGSTLHLSGGGNYEINASSTTGDSYDTLRIGAATQIRSWSSDASTVVTDTGGSYYSQDNAGLNGDLYIYGDYSKSSGIDYWSYAIDFDGTDISGSPRLVEVLVEGGSTITYNGTADLSVLGVAAASTTIDNQGSGVYGFNIEGSASTTMNYYDFSNLDADGLTFDDTPTVTDLSYGYFLVANNNDVAITLDGSVITANPALTFTNNIFATSSGVATAYNVRATSSSASGWQFTNHSGDIDGEDFDDDPGPNSGNPGYIGWDNSSSSITISGTVYQSNRSSASAVCSVGVLNVTMVINTDTSTSTDCNGSGDYQFGPISFADNASVVVFIDNETADATTVTYDPVTSVSNLDLYEDHLIVRHEGGAALTSTVMDDYDSADDDDNDVLYLVTGTDLTVATDTVLLVWTSKEFAPGGDVTIPSDGGGPSYDGDLELLSGATYTTGAGERHSIGGSLISAAGATYDASTATTTFTSTAAETIDINDGSFYNVEFTGSGSWSVSDNLLDLNSLRQTAGTLTLPTGTTTVSGFWNSTTSTLANNGSLIIFDGGDAGNKIAFADSDVAELQFTGSGSWHMDDLNATSTSNVTVESGTLTLPSGSLVVEGSFRNTGGSLTHNSGELILSTSTAATLLASSSDLYSLTFRGGGDYTFEDTSLTLLGTLEVNNATATLTTTESGSTLSISGSLDASAGVFDTATGSVLFNSADTGETISMGTNPFYNIVFGSGSGGWTITSDATTTRNFTLTSASDFTLQSGATLYVGNVFDNSVGGSATTWDGSTLILDSGSEFAINGKSDAGDDYQNLVIGANTDISSWYSQATTTIVDSSSSWYSQDHASSTGSLYIYGDYHISTTTEYWSYATDFDGTSLSGSERVVTVSLANGATTTVDGGTLNIVGASGNETLITNQGSGNYDMLVSAGTLNAQYYQFRNLAFNGLYLADSPTISSLNYGDFELAVDGGRLITLSSTTLNANASLVISGNRFATTSAISGTNVYLVGTTTAAWTFTSHTGNLAGENYDYDGGSNCGQVRWDNSGCQLVQQTQYRWRLDNGGLGAPDGEWYDASWGARKAVRITNPNSTTTLDAVVELTVAYDSDMQTDFEDLYFTDASGTTTINHFIASTTNSVSAEVWVEVPSLTANDITTVYMYYFNPTATSSSSSTLTFIAADDFEDNNLSEYSGSDLALFAVNGNNIYGGSYGLDGTDNSGKADSGGIARFDQTVSQGETIRYMQYVDTNGGDDEVCTMFGVQSPVTGSNNYAVCLEQVAGTDFVALSQDVVQNANTANIMASSTISGGFNDGWYEVEIDWGTDDSIFVSVYDDQENLVATTSSSSSAYTSGGYGFTYWFNEGGWDNFSSRPTLGTEPTVTFGAEVGDSGADWAAAQNTSYGTAPSTTVRLRLAIENSGLSTTTTLGLEYAAKGVAPSCESISGASYVDVPVPGSCGGSPVCMEGSSNFADGDSTADLLMSTVGTFTAGETIEDPSNETSSLTLGQDEFTEIEYALALSPSASDTNYCFRAGAGSGALNTYLKVAELQVRFDPTMGLVYMSDRDSMANINLIGGTTTRVYATTTVSDQNGYSDMVAATSTFYHSNVTAACSADPNNCYISTNTAGQCSFTNCAGNSCLLECYADFYYLASSTDSDGGLFWYAFMEVEDNQGGTDFDTSFGQDVTELSALDVLDPINYVSLEVASSSGTDNASTTVENIGNISIDITLIGTDMSDGGSSLIPAGQQKYATTTFDYDACTNCTNLATTAPPTLVLDLVKPISTSTPITDEVYWGIAIPFGVASNPHTGINTFMAVPD